MPRLLQVCPIAMLGQVLVLSQVFVYKHAVPAAHAALPAA
jgi:hypothetical protein